MNSNTHVSQKGLDKVRSNSQTDNEEEDDEEDIEEEEEGGSTEEEQEEQSQKCQWEDCDEEFNKLEELTNHVKADHIGSGKVSYYGNTRECYLIPCRHNTIVFGKNVLVNKSHLRKDTRCITIYVHIQEKDHLYAHILVKQSKELYLFSSNMIH